MKQYSTNRTTVLDRTSIIISVPDPLGTSGSFGQWQVLKVIALSFGACLDVHQVNIDMKNQMLMASHGAET